MKKDLLFFPVFLILALGSMNPKFGLGDNWFGIIIIIVLNLALVVLSLHMIISALKS
jgi:hypothetical protein